MSDDPLDYLVDRFGVVIGSILFLFAVLALMGLIVAGALVAAQ